MHYFFGGRKKVGQVVNFSGRSGQKSLGCPNKWAIEVFAEIVTRG
jgi:hypothetical protein